MATIVSAFKAAVAAKAEEFRVAAGWWDGTVAKLDSAKLVKFLFGVVEEEATVTGDQAGRQKVEKALARLDLFYRAYPDLPRLGSEEYDALDEIEHEAYGKCKGDVLNQLLPDASKQIQKVTGISKPGFVFCRTIVDRGGVETDAVYITDNPKLIMADFAFVLRDAVRKAAEKEAKNLGMVMVRRPEMAAKLRKELEASLTNATNFARSTLALSSGSTDDES